MNLNKINFVFDKNNEKEIREKAIINIKALFDLISKDIEDNKLIYGSKEHRVCLYMTLHQEAVCIRYPGKESNTEKSDYKKNPIKLRPFDFRPEIIKEDGKEIENLSFINIWRDLSKLNKEQKQLISNLFFRMSILADTNIAPTEQRITIQEFKNNKWVKFKDETITWYPVSINEEILREFDDVILHSGFSLEACLYYNDLLCQNEDCKYFYRDEIASHKFPKSEKDKKKRWDGKIGRRNTYSSHISVMGALEDVFDIPEICGRLMQSRGVCKLNDDEIKKILDNHITIINKIKKDK